MEPFYAHFFLWFVYNHVKTSPHLRLLFSRTPQRRFAAKLQKRNDKPSLEFDMFCDAWEWADNDFWMNCSFKVMTEIETTVYTALNTPLKSFRRSNCLLFFILYDTFTNFMHINKRLKCLLDSEEGLKVHGQDAQTEQKKPPVCYLYNADVYKLWADSLSST